MSAESSSEQVKKPMPSTGARIPKRLIRETVEFSVRGPVAVNLDENHKSLPGCSVIDLVFPGPSKVREIVFRNYYTAWLTIMVRLPHGKDGVASTSATSFEDAGGSWALSILHRTLMKSPHVETGAQEFVSVTYYESLVEWDNLLGIRLVLRQPSPTWRTFHVEELNVFSDTPRYTQPPITYFTSQGMPRHIQQYETLLALIIKQTRDSLIKKDPATEEASSNSKDNVQACYEFFNLPPS